MPTSKPNAIRVRPVGLLGRVGLFHNLQGLTQVGRNVFYLAKLASDGA